MTFERRLSTIAELFDIKEFSRINK